MAMLTRAKKISLQRFQNCFSAFLLPLTQTAGNTQAQQQRSTHLNTIDSFTNELISGKMRKWEELRDTLLKKKSNDSATIRQNVSFMTKRVINDIQELRSPQLGLDIRTLSRPQLDNLLLSTLEIKNKVDFLYLIRQCLKWKRLPSHDVLIPCLKYLSTLCRLQQIESFAEICRSQKHPVTKIHADLAPFKAMALWRSGSADVALATLQRGYAETTNSEEGRRMIRAAFRTIAEETLSQKSEAVLVLLMNVARSIYFEHKDIFVLACVWKQCFFSDWFCDQKVAADLFDYFKELQTLVGKRSSALCSSFLGRHNVDAVHRLIEVFLQNSQRDPCANCLSLLFNYQYLRKDLRACAEIIKSCSELEMPLCEMQNEQFLSLFLDQTEISNNTGPRHLNSNQKIKSSNQFQYKF